jgi:formamidopyrimidine-DNA glycosylase
VLVNNSTNINKTKESVNSAGQQFHQYQQNKESVSSAGQQFHQYQQNKRKCKQCWWNC